MTLVKEPANKKYAIFQKTNTKVVNYYQMHLVKNTNKIWSVLKVWNIKIRFSHGFLLKKHNYRNLRIFLR
jgi:hypothetical protein